MRLCHTADVLGSKLRVGRSKRVLPRLQILLPRPGGMGHSLLNIKNMQFWMFELWEINMDLSRPPRSSVPDVASGYPQAGLKLPSGWAKSGLLQKSQLVRVKCVPSWPSGAHVGLVWRPFQAISSNLRRGQLS